MRRTLVMSGATAAALAFAVACGVGSGLPTTAVPLLGVASGAAAEDADRQAVIAMAKEFADAFNRRDAKAIVALHTENAESRDENGDAVVGGVAIGKAYEALFKAEPALKIEVMVGSVRFPAKDIAIEEGLVRHSHGPASLPSTSTYVAVHAREGGKWRIALSKENVAEERLENLEWLLGKWTTKTERGTLTMTFQREPGKPVVTGRFTRAIEGKDPIVGQLRIAPDPETGQIRSWGFEDDGAHWQSLWSCDGKSWILDTRGVIADGTPLAERIVLQRVEADVITWRIIDRVLGDEMLQDSVPMRLDRIVEK